MITPWVDIVRKIMDGWEVDAQHTNIPIDELGQRTQYLKDMLDSLGAGEALYYRGVAVDAQVTPGMPVYLDDASGEFKPALADIDYDIYGNYGPVAKSAYVWGVAANKITSVTADILVAGIIRNADMSGIIDTLDQSGAYYLSTATPGKLTLQKPPVSVYVLYWWADQKVALVTPTPREVLEDHIHYRFELTAAPAGIANCAVYGERHAVILPDPDQEGWLPAGHPVFGGVAPPGARFGYNMAKDIWLSRVFPPIPVDSYYVEVFRGDEGTGRDPATMVRVDNNGIWWMSDCYGEAPWPVWHEPCSSSSLSSLGGDCPPPDLEFLPGHGYDRYPYPMSIYLWFSKMVYKTDSSVVTRITTDSGSAVKFFKPGTDEEAESGHLEARADIQYSIEDTDAEGANVVKTAENNKLQRGYVVDRVKSNSPFIVISGTRELDDGYQQGSLVIDFSDPSVSARELPVELVALNNVRQDDQGGVLYYSFLAGRTAWIRFKLEAPFTGFPAAARLKLGLRILATASGTMPDLPMTYRVIPPADVLTDVPGSDTSLGTLALSDLGVVSADKYVDVISPEFDVVAGATIFVSISRDTDGYGGDIGIIRQRGLVTPT